MEDREASSSAARNAGAFLHELLLHDYRHRWMLHSERRRPDRVNSLAVARVVAEYVGVYPTASRGWETDAASLKDVVWRALNGRGMSRETMELIVAAFDIDATNAEALRRQWSGAEAARVVVGSMPSRPAVSATPPRYETVQRQELHYLGADGQPNRHRTVQAIRSLVDDYATHRFVFDTDEVTVSRVHGGLPGPPQHLDGSLWVVDIALPHVLAAGEIASMEFVTQFHTSTQLPPVFRYAAHQRVEDLVIRVEFDPARQPATVVWCEWEDYAEPARLRHQRSMTLDNEYAVTHSLDVLERAAVGFSWTFET